MPFVIPMPLNAKGEGPVPDEEAVRTVWEIWDDDFVTISEHDSKREAEEALAKLLNP